MSAGITAAWVTAFVAAAVRLRDANHTTWQGPATGAPKPVRDHGTPSR